MNRRRFFGLLAATPVLIATVPTPASGGVAMGRAYTIGEAGMEAIMPIKPRAARLAVELDTSDDARSLRDLEGMIAKMKPGRGYEVTFASDPDQTFLDGAGI